jgi:hypothetical protein
MAGLGQQAFPMLLMLLASAASADQWPPATVKTYTSSQGTYRLTVYPRDLEGPLEYFQDKVAGKARAGQQPGGQARCEAVLEQLEGSEYRRLWRKPLVNDVSPVRALVSEKDGSFVTFDNWHSRGWGDDVIVIYSGAGQPRRKFALTSLMSQEKVEQLPRSISSIGWSCGYEIGYDEQTVNVRVVVDGDAPSSDERRCRTVRLSLETGEVLQ